jgi:glycosyltransferase involved in cell wall biosynthesis
MPRDTIFMITPFSHPNIGGVESHINKLTNYLSRKDCKVILATYQPLTTQLKGSAYEVNNNLEVYRMNWFGNGWFHKLERFFPLVFLYLFPGLFYKSLKVYFSKRKKIDVIHAHGFVSALIAKIIAKISRKRCVVSTHAIYNLKERKLLAFLVKWVLHDFDAILAVGEPSRLELIDIGLPSNKVKVHPNWIDIDEYTPLDRDFCRNQIGLKSDDFVVLFLGRMIEKKGVLILLEAAKKTKKNIKFLFAGDGPLAEEIIEVSKSNKKIKYLGRIEEREKAIVYNSADLFVAPVLYEEGFATVYLEALACGTPIVTSKRGCLPYFLTSKVTDFVDKVSIDNILLILDKHYENKFDLNVKRGICREFAEGNFSEDNARIILDSYAILAD